ncbi:MAG: hypothetical protein J6U93_05545 [Alistipes sp.]|nr:hypothetical protein [Alistipes sp.]
MKKLFTFLALVLGLVSCQTEPEGFDVNVGGEQDVNIIVSLPEGTRADSAQGFDLTNLGDYSIRYILEVAYNGKVIRDAQISKNRSVSFPVRLAPGREYTFTVWADLVTATTIDKAAWSDTDNFYDTSAGLSNITFKTWTPNTEARDAWTDTKKVTFTGASDVQMNLTRPFAKVRVVATDIAEIRKFGIEPTNAVAEYFTAEMYTKFNAVTGVASDVATKKHEFDYTDATRYELTTDNSQFTVFTDYVFVPADGNVQFTLNVYDNTKGADALIKANSFNTAIPVEANNVTSIVGNVLTMGDNISIEVKPEFENADNITDEPYYKQTISSAAEFYAALNNEGEYIVISDINITSSAIETRATRAAAEGKVTTINLNGKTITVTNKTTAPFATVAAGNTLFLEGGNIVLAEGSKASFIKNEGNVVLTNGTLENESNHNTAAVVEGKVIAEENATVTDNNTTKVENWLADVLTNGGTYVFTEDMEAGQIKVTATAPVVLDGNGYTFTYTGSDRAIEIPRETTGANVTIKNLNIVLNAGHCERGINFNVTGGTLTIDNVKVSETGTAATYAINLPGYSDNATVVINNSYLRGNIALNVWGKDMKITATDTEFVSYDNVEAENYAAISLNNDGATNIADGTVVTIEGGKIIALDENGEEADAISNLTNTGTVAVSGSTEVIGILSDPVAIVTYAGYDQFYSCTTLQQAINQAAKNSNTTVKLIKDITLDKPVMVAENQTIVLDLGGKTINAGLKQEGRHHYAIDNYGTLTLKGNGFINARGVQNFGTMTVEEGVTITNVDTNGGAAIWNEGNIIINGGTFKTNESAGIGSYGNALSTLPGGKTVVNGGIFEAYSQLHYAIVNEGETTINNADVKGKHGAVSGAETNDKTAIYGGTFKLNGNPDNSDHCVYCVSAIYGGTFSIVVPDPAHGDSVFCESKIAEGYAVIEKDNTYTVIPTVLTDGYVLDLGGAEYDGTITVEGNVTIKGDTKIKTLKSTTGCTITIEDGKTLTLNNFSFGAKDNAGAEYEIKGGTVTANYGFFQHGKYTLRSNFETGYMYYSYGSDITVYGTFHSQGKGDGLDYVRGKLTIAKGGKSIHDKSLWVGQPANWGAMNASLVIEEGGYVQANSLSIYEGSSLTYSNDADLKYNSVTGAEYITKK